MNFIINFRETFIKKRETIFLGKMFFCAATALFCLNFSNFAQSCIEKKAKIDVLTVEVVVDNIQEKGISSQIFEMAKNAFSKIPPEENGKEYAIAINLSERSFYKNVDVERSLYAHYQLFSESGECVLENVFCSESKNSIMSATAQKRQVERIAKDLKKFFAGAKESDA